MITFTQDIRHAVRMLTKSPGMLVLSVLALTLGIGMPTIMFTIVNGMFSELPVEEPDRVVRLVRTDRERGGVR